MRRGRNEGGGGGGRRNEGLIRIIVESHLLLYPLHKFTVESPLAIVPTS